MTGCKHIAVQRVGRVMVLSKGASRCEKCAKALNYTVHHNHQKVKGNCDALIKHSMRPDGDGLATIDSL